MLSGIPQRRWVKDELSAVRSAERSTIFSVLKFCRMIAWFAAPRLFAQQVPPTDPVVPQQLSGRADSAPDRVPFISVIFPEALPPLLPQSKLQDWTHGKRLRVYGWVDGGFTYASTGHGLFSTLHAKPLRG
jgi:hypothetical protein